MEALIPVGLVLLFAGMFARKKKKTSGGGPLRPGPDVDRPTPTTRPPGPSDPLPGGSKGGHLPKDQGYAPPADMTTADLWVSPDCQAWVAGADWIPMAEGLDPYDYFIGYDNGRSYTEGAMELNQAAWDENLDVYAFEYKPGPLNVSVMQEFLYEMLAEEAPLCAETLPMPWEYDDPDEYDMDMEAWVASYPALVGLLEYARTEAAEVTAVQGVNVARHCGEYDEEYVGYRSMYNAWDDNMPAGVCDGIAFTPVWDEG